MPISECNDSALPELRLMSVTYPAGFWRPKNHTQAGDQGDEKGPARPSVAKAQGLCPHACPFTLSKHSNSASPDKTFQGAGQRLETSGMQSQSSLPTISPSWPS